MALKKLALCFVAMICAACTSGAADYHPGFDRNFDEYGLVRWRDERARLDNFAIQLQNDPDLIGYIFVYDGENVCEGEAKARAIRARKYVVEFRGIPWNRVMWRYEGYLGNFMIALQPASRTVHFDYPFRGPLKEMTVEHVTRQCAQRLAKVEKTKLGSFE